jgi:transketolase
MKEVTLSMNDQCESVALARAIRSHILCMAHRAHGYHVGSSLSMADILAVLYCRVLRVDPTRPDWPDRDRLIVSKGHGAAAVFSVLAERGFFPTEWLESYYKDGARLPGHVTYGVPGVEVSSGSLGHGLSIGCGMALASKSNGRSNRVFVVLSDGDCQSGSTWEAALFAHHHALDNLVAIVDHNKIQAYGTVKEVLDVEPLADKWHAFRWTVREIDGHDCELLEGALGSVPFETGKPSIILAHTIKGKGVSFMENDLASSGWHYGTPDDRQLAQGLAELGVKQ